MSKRPFRSEESLRGERATRDNIGPLLASQGFSSLSETREVHGTAITQYVEATRNGQHFKMHVRICWRRGGRNARELLYSAAQLRTRLVANDWEATLRFLETRAVEKGVTHILFVQDSDDGYQHAALVPYDAIAPIWHRQRHISAELSKAGKTGNWTKNHAENGSSPTIWLQDDRWPEAVAVADVLWNWPDVIDVLGLPSAETLEGDSVDDLHDGGLILGRDAGVRRDTMRSGYPRDPRVRAEVLRRAVGHCERPGCQIARDFPSFLDVHHILGVAASDRPWTCVAICPNCHREAHFAPNRDEMNAELATYAARFNPGDL